ncbi:MAG: hypothetical protein IPJ34_28410 [Myxococcales bacterium]|nr:hypothetical protein [Myxococcales bacterium]
MDSRALLLLVLPLAGCTAKLEGSIDLDGKTFRAPSCRSLTPMGYTGVELEAADGARLRVVERADGDAEVFYFAASKNKGKSYGACATMKIQKQNSSVNKVTNVEGRVKLDCPDADAKGEIKFENCH